MRRVFFIALALASACAFAQAQELTGALRKIKETGSISVGYAEGRAPFSYLDATKNPAGYSIEICKRVIAAIKVEVKRPDLKVQMLPVKPADAVALARSNGIDLHCGPVANTPINKAQVDFGMTYYIMRYVFVSRESAHMMELSDIGGHTVVSNSSMPVMNALQAYNAAHGNDMSIVSATSDEEAFRIFESGQADAVVLDDVAIAQYVARSNDLMMVSNAAVGVEPYSLIFARGDKPFKALVDETMRNFFRSGGVQPLYAKWFQRGMGISAVNMPVAMSDALARVLRNPTDSTDPAVYR